jgi:hypothetical protein
MRGTSVDYYSVQSMLYLARYLFVSISCVMEDDGFVVAVNANNGSKILKGV